MNTVVIALALLLIMAAIVLVVSASGRTPVLRTAVSLVLLCALYLLWTVMTPLKASVLWLACISLAGMVGVFLAGKGVRRRS